jgi:choline dehydrogenase-like flavoprotein
MADLGVLDVLVIGGGMGGCIVATRLAEHGVHPETGKPLRIAILERGPYFKGDRDPSPGYGIPFRRNLFTSVAQDSRENTRYTMASGFTQDEVDRGIRQRYVNTRRGDASAIGGGSLHWNCNTQVPFDLDYGAYAEETGVDWTVEKLRSASQEIQRLFNIHGRPESLLNPGDLLFRDSAKALGYSVIPLTIAKRNCIACGFCSLMCKYDAKMGPLITHVPLAEKLGVQIIPEAEVDKLILEKQGARVVAKGAIYRHQGATESVTADKVIVACGVFGTPPLLFRSGYGRRDVLGSDLIVENPNIGKNVDAKVSAPRIQAVFAEAIHDGEYRDGSFDLFQDVHPQGYFDRLQMNFRVQRLAATPDALARGRTAPEFGREHKEFMRQIYNLQGPNNATRAAQLRRGGLGVAVVRPSGVLGVMDAYGELQYDRKDPVLLRRLKDGYEIGHEILKKMGAKEISGSVDEVSVRTVAGITGSCRAGSDRSNSVVNSDFESHDVENLLICDASSPPRIASRGFGSPVAVFATYAAQRLVTKYFS